MTAKSDQWYGATGFNEYLDAASEGSVSKTFYNTPGSVEEFLSWAGALEEGNRGVAASRESPASFQITGTKEVMTNLSHILAVATDKAMARLRLNAEYILAESEKEVPVDMTYETAIVTLAVNIPASSRWYGNVGTKSYVQRKRSGRMKGGFLKSTGTVENGDDGESFDIGYNTPYAHRQHEDLTYHHTRPGAKAKYLEDPAMRIAPTIAADIAEALKGFL